METENIIYILVIIFLLYSSWKDSETSIIRKLSISILFSYLLIHSFGDIFKTDDEEGPAHCRFMREYLSENLMKNVNSETVGENISIEVDKLNENLKRITEKSYACNCEDASDFMKDGKSLKEIYSSRCDNKCRFMDRPLTKCNIDEDCDFPAGCFHYDESLKLFQPHSSDSDLGVCVLEGSTHHISDLIEIYGESQTVAGATTPNSPQSQNSGHGDNINSYLSDDNATPFCFQPSTDLKKVIDFNEDNKHYVETDESQGHHCCLKKSFIVDQDQTDKALSFTSEYWKEHHDAIINRAAVILLTNLGIMGAKMLVAFEEARTAMGAAARANEVAISALRSEGIAVDLAQLTNNPSRLVELGRSVEYSKAEPISIALRWTLFGGRGAGIVGKFPGLFGILETIVNFTKGTFVAKGLAGVVLRLSKGAGLTGSLALSRFGAVSLGARGFSTAASEAGRAIGAKAAESAIGRAGGAVLARGVFSFARTLVTGPVGMALMVIQGVGMIMDNYDVGGYQNLLTNKELLKLFDAYTGAYIDGMKTATQKEPPYGIDISATFFDHSGEKLIWPFNKCTEEGGEDCNTEFIKNKHDNEAAKALIIIVGALKEVESNEIAEKMKDVIQHMTEGLKDDQIYMDFLDEYQTSLDDASTGDNETEQTANFLNEWMLGMITHGYTPTEAMERDRRYAGFILGKLKIKMPDTYHKYIGWVNQGGTSVINYSELTNLEKTKLTEGDIESPLVYLNTKLSSGYSGIQLTKRGVKLYNRYRNLREDQEYIAFSKKYIDIADKLPRAPEVPADGVSYTYQLQKRDCHTQLGINENEYPGFAQGTMLNKLDHICRYGTKWGKEGAAVDTTQWGSSSEDLMESWVYMKNGVPDTNNQPFGQSISDPCPWACVELNDIKRNELSESGQTPDTGSLSHSKHNFNNRMMAYNYNIYMRESLSQNNDTGLEGDNNNNYNKQDPKSDYINWSSFDEESASGIDDWKEWRSTTLIAYLMDPDDAIDDENFTCNITDNRVRASSYCHRMAGNDDTFTQGLRHGGIGPLKTTYNDRFDSDSTSYADNNYRVYNECIKSWGHEALDDIFGTALVTSVERIFDWF